MVILLTRLVHRCGQGTWSECGVEDCYAPASDLGLPDLEEHIPMMEKGRHEHPAQ